MPLCMSNFVIKYKHISKLSEKYYVSVNTYTLGSSANRSACIQDVELVPNLRLSKKIN